MRWISLLAAAALIGATSQTHLRETGSSLLFPVIAKWAQVYHTVNPDVDVATESTGSGAGIKGATDGIAEIGASDAYLSNDQLKAGGLMNIAVTISAQTVDYNVPEVSDAHLQFNPVVLAKIFSGTVKFWDDPAIAAINKDIAAKLPHQAIVPIVRSDSSGDTFLFTQYLSGDAGWKSGVGSGTTVKWPAADGEQSAKGNGGVLKLCSDTKYALCYLGISYIIQASGANLHFGAVMNPSGAYVLPSVGAIGSAAMARVDQTPASESVSLINGPAPDSYPIVNYEYAIVKAHQKSPALAKALRAFLTWALNPDTGGNNGSNLTPGFTQLPKAVQKMSQAQIDSIK